MSNPSELVFSNEAGRYVVDYGKGQNDDLEWFA